MTDVRLTKGLRLPNRGLLFPGTVIDATDEELKIIKAVGADTTNVKVDPPRGKSEKPEEIPDAEEQLERVEEASRPKNTEKQEVWEAYARKLGIDPKGMTKQEIINATK